MLCLDVSLSFFLSFFFFKQKTAYEMRISDWSSDVCSSDLAAAERILLRIVPGPLPHRDAGRCRLVGLVTFDRLHPLGKALRQEGNRRDRKQSGADHVEKAVLEIGRAPSELQSLMRISYAVFCLNKKINTKQHNKHRTKKDNT